MRQKRKQQAQNSTQMHELDMLPALLIQVELGQPLPIIPMFDEKTGRLYRRAICFVRLHTYPLGGLELRFDGYGARPQDYAHYIWDTFETKINEHLQQDGLPARTRLDHEGIPGPTQPKCVEERERFIADAPFVSVIVPTHNRPDLIATCLQSLLSLHYPRYEIIVVDNAPATHATAEFIEHTYGDVAQIRYLREDQQGPALARNSGLMAAKGEITVFCDDDMLVDRYWLVELVRGFSLASKVACVNGHVLPRELETPAQLWFEEYCRYSWSNHWFTTRISSHSQRHVHLYRPALFGAGASMAFDTKVLRSIKGFDTLLGGNGPVRTGEDVYAIFQIVMHGYTVVYKPTSLAYHPHYREYEKLRVQLYNYGIGLPAFLMKSLLDHPQLLFDLVTKVPYEVLSLLKIRSLQSSMKTTSFPKDLSLAEKQGMLYGPLAYLQTWWMMRNTRKAFQKAFALIED